MRQKWRKVRFHFHESSRWKWECLKCSCLIMKLLEQKMLWFLLVFFFLFFFLFGFFLKYKKEKTKSNAGPTIGYSFWKEISLTTCCVHWGRKCLCTNAQAHTYKLTHTHTSIHTQHTHTHTHTYTQAHMHTHTSQLRSNFFNIFRWFQLSVEVSGTFLWDQEFYKEGGRASRLHKVW